MSTKKLSSEQELNDLLDSASPVWLLKHSSTCPVSSYAKQEFDAYINESGDPAGMIVVQDARPLSNHVADRFGIKHESPQAFLIVDGKVKWHASHGAILARDMKQALTKA